MEFIDKKDTGREPQPIELGFLHYMAAGMSLADIRKMSPEDLIKVGNEYLEKEASAVKAFEKLIKKYSHMKENIKAEDKVSLSELLEGYCSVCGMATCESGCNSKKEGTESEDDGYPANLEEGPYSEAYLLDLENSLKKLVGFLKDQQNDPDTLKHRHVIDQLPELIDTLEDISFSAGYDRAMKEDYNQAGEFEPKHLMDLAPGEEFTFNGKTYTFIKMAGGDEITAHVEDSTGFELVVSFGGGMVNTGEVSGTGMADMGLGKGHHIDEEEEDRDEELIAKLTPVSQVLDEKDYDADQAQKDDEEDEERGYDDDGLPLGEESLNEAPNFEIIDKCLADYRKWARKQDPDSKELYDTTQAFIKTLQRLG